MCKLSYSHSRVLLHNRKSRQFGNLSNCSSELKPWGKFDEILKQALNYAVKCYQLILMKLENSLNVHNVFNCFYYIIRDFQYFDSKEVCLSFRFLVAKSIIHLLRMFFFFSFLMFF